MAMGREVARGDLMSHESLQPFMRLILPLKVFGMVFVLSWWG
jgi:hypothetical protein